MITCLLFYLHHKIAISTHLCLSKRTVMFFFLKKLILKTRCLHFYNFTSDFFIKLLKILCKRSQRKPTIFNNLYIMCTTNKIIVHLFVNHIAGIAVLISLHAQNLPETYMLFPYRVWYSSRHNWKLRQIYLNKYKVIPMSLLCTNGSRLVQMFLKIFF